MGGVEGKRWGDLPDKEGGGEVGLSSSVRGAHGGSSRACGQASHRWQGCCWGGMSGAVKEEEAVLPT